MLNAASFRRMAVLASLIAVLAVPQASAASPRLDSPGLLDRFLSVLRLDLKAGCKIDPSGRCSTNAAQPPNTKEGCVLDPNGRCHTNTEALHTDIGCVLDPNGRCRQ